MSLYNMLFGENNETPILLGMLGLNKDFFDRFRDVELIKDGTIIRVFTRLGGGNREGYEQTWNKIQSHELYIKDYDDDFDCTYAYIEFDIPDKYKKTAKKMFKGEPVSFEDKFMKEINEMDKPGTKAFENAQKIADKINNAIENGETNIGL